MARLSVCEPLAEEIRETPESAPAQSVEPISVPEVDDSVRQAIHHSLKQSSLTPPAERRWKLAIMLVSAVVLGVSLLSGKLHMTFSLLPDNHLGYLFWYTALFYGGLMYAVTLWRVVLWRRYKPMPSVTDEALPAVSVIIPAFNEGRLVRQSILSVAHSDYPREKLEIIAIDDGSADDTWEHIRAAAAEVDSRIRMTTFKQPRNKGKREALYIGFKQARGSVIVSIDSDSIVEPDALRNGVTPLVLDPTLGCVAGCVEVLNPRQSLITRFLKCTFSLSFKFVRAYQSEFRGVFCTPGALSIYRAEIVRRVADEWVNQKFLGMPCTIGEDRAMTNLILREGWMTAYQGNAVVWSKMPHTYTGMCKMLLRWGRSNVRETLFLFKFLFKNFRNRYLRTFQFNMLLTALTLFLPPFMILNSYLLLFTSGGYVMHQLGMLVVYAATMSLIYYFNERDTDWVWLFLYEFLWPIGFAWIIPYATITMRKTAWLTRMTSVDLKLAPEEREPARPILAGAGALQPAVSLAPDR